MPIAAFTPTRGASSVCHQRTLRAGQFIFERTKTVRHKGHLINPHNSHEFSRKRMHLSGKPEGDPCLSMQMSDCSGEKTGAASVVFNYHVDRGVCIHAG